VAVEDRRRLIGQFSPALTRDSDASGTADALSLPLGNSPVSFLDSGAVRAGTFFTAAFLVAALLGVAIGYPRVGVAAGIPAGLVMAVFGGVFVRPAQ
jgi:hypothetical protein